MPAAPMIREAAADSLSSSVLRWGFRVVGASVRMAVVAMIALLFVAAISTTFAIDLYITSRSAARRNKRRKPLRRSRTPIQTHTLELPGY